MKAIKKSKSTVSAAAVTLRRLTPPRPLTPPPDIYPPAPPPTRDPNSVTILHTDADSTMTIGGTIRFENEPRFTPNLTPAEMMRLGSFGGTSFR